MVIFCRTIIVYFIWLNSHIMIEINWDKALLLDLKCRGVNPWHLEWVGWNTALIQDFRAIWTILHWYCFTVHNHLAILISNFGKRVEGRTFFTIVLFSLLGEDAFNNRQVNWWHLINTVETNIITCQLFVNSSISWVMIYFSESDSVASVGSIYYGDSDETRTMDS